MWIFFRVAVGMVGTVHQGVGPWAKERRALESIGHEIEGAFPKWTGGKHPMGGIAVMEKCLEE